MLPCVEKLSLREVNKNTYTKPDISFRFFSIVLAFIK